MNIPGEPTVEATHAAHLTLAQLPTSGEVKTDLTHAAYLLFSGLLVTASAVALAYGRKALVLVGRRMGARASRLASGVADKMADELEKCLRINEYSEEGRSRVMTETVSSWINHGKDDACIAAGIRALQLLEEPMSGRRVLESQFNLKSLVRESLHSRKPVFDKTLDFYDTVIALVQGQDILPPDREKLLAALALHLPEAGREIRPELASLIDSLRGMKTSLPAGVRLLANGDADKIAAFKDRPGVKVLSHISWPLNQSYSVREDIFIHREQSTEPFVRVDGRPDGKLRVGPPPPASAEAAAEKLAAATPVTDPSASVERNV